jgi:hypothetical protein
MPKTSHTVYTRMDKNGYCYHSLYCWVIQVCSLLDTKLTYKSDNLFSPLTAIIYFPAIPAIAVSFHKSIELINVTVTMYMVFQGISL